MKTSPGKTTSNPGVEARRASAGSPSAAEEVTSSEPAAGASRSSGSTEAAAEDRIFAQPRGRATDFEFGSETAQVFDNMVSRSVPFYDEIQRMTCEIAADFGVPGSNLYDLGCATGTTLEALHPRVAPGVRFVGVDNSEEMLEKARQKCARLAASRAVDLVNADLNGGPVVENASVAVMLLTLQFVRPLYRERVVQGIFHGLNDKGCVIVVEKILGTHSLLNRLYIKYYYDLKRRRGYSDIEIAQKREALENVLVPYRFEENTELLHRVGFQYVEEFFRWYNFCGIVAVK